MRGSESFGFIESLVCAHLRPDFGQKSYGYNGRRLFGNTIAHGSNWLRSGWNWSSRDGILWSRWPP